MYKWQGHRGYSSGDHAVHQAPRMANQNRCGRALPNARIADISGGLSVLQIWRFLQLVDIMAGIELQPGVRDTHIWEPASEVSSQRNQRMIDTILEG